MSLRLRFLLSLLALLALMTVPALYGARRVTALRDIALELQGQAAQSALAAGRLQAALGQVDRFQRAYVATTEPELAVRMHAALREAASEIAMLRAAGYGDAVERVGLDLHQLAAVNVRIETLVQQRLLDAATDYLGMAATPLVDQSRAAIPLLAAAIDAKTGDRVLTAQRSAAEAATATTLALVVALGLACALAIGTASVLTRPLERLRLAVARVAEGAFEAPGDLPYERADELGHLSRSFRTMTLRLAELDRLKAEFVGTASHDLKTPISIIDGYVQLIEEELGDSLQVRHRELFAAIAEQTGTLQRRVDRLLEISRMEAGRLRLGLEEINLRQFAQEVHRAFEPAAQMRGLRLDLDVHDNIQPFLIADPDVLRTDVLGNLIGNALKFTPAGGLVRVTIRPEGERVHIEVADNGPGIAPDQVGRIFDKYYQGRNSSGGAGLGLAIAKAAIEAHGGRIEAQSPPGQGARFRIVLPVRATPAPQQQHAAPAV
jgi:two-component system, NtrC family, sensor histidine kinase GlrK